MKIHSTPMKSGMFVMHRPSVQPITLVSVSLSLSRQYRAPLVEAVRTAFTNYNLWIRKLAKKFVAIPRTQYAQRDEMKQSVLQIIADNHQDLVADMIETQYFAHYVDSRRT
jgi:hypothetical protein